METRREILKSGIWLTGILAACESPASVVKSLLGAKLSGYAEGSKDWRNPYVTDGLVAMWDGEWNAGGGVHDASAMTWKDISARGNDLTCNGVPSWDTTQVLIGNYFYSDSAADVISAFNNHAVTLEIVYGSVQAAYNNTGPFGIGTDGVIKIQQNRGSNTACNLTWLGVYCPLSGFLGPAPGAYAKAIYAISDTEWTMSSIRSDGTTFNYITTSSFTQSIQSGSRLFVGWSKDNASGGYGIRCVRIYSRALTAAEGAHNYLVDKERFNLP